MTPKTAKAVHSLLLAIGMGVATSLMVTFAAGLPLTKGAWVTAGNAALAAGLSRFFGWWLNRHVTP